MDIVFAGKGVVAAKALGILQQMPINLRFYHGADKDLMTCDLLLSVHWPHKFSPTVLEIPKIGCLNLHNSYLPWNKGANACTWAIIDGTPHGATLHWMDEGIDTGPIFYQERMEIMPDDTADTLYRRTMEVELKTLKIGMEMMLSGERRRITQSGPGSFHKRADYDTLVRAMTTSDSFVVRR